MFTTDDKRLIAINSGPLQTFSDEEVAQPDCKEESLMENRWQGSERSYEAPVS